jgi:alpha-glucoside transport system substrate-binding protein
MSIVRLLVRPVIIVLLLAGALGGCTQAAANETTVTVLGSWTGTEQAGFLAMVRGFERKYDNRIHVTYIFTRDAPAVLANDLKNGDLPDLAVVATPGVMREYAAEGKLVPINGALDLQTMKSQYSPSWLQFMQATGPLGTDAYYAIIVKAALKSVIWYDPSQLPARYQSLLTSGNLTWNQLMSLTADLSATGVTPWCIGMADSSNSGWPGTDWIEDIVLHHSLLNHSGLYWYNLWVEGKLAWTSDPIKQAFGTFGQVAASTATPRLVQGGTTSELSTSYGSVGQGLFTSPRGCYLDHEGSFITGTDFYLQDGLGSANSGRRPQPGTDFEFIPFPPLTSADRNNREVGGDLLGMFHDTPAARAFINYLTTPQAQEAWISLPGSGAISVNEAVPLSEYPDSVSRAAAMDLIQAPNVSFDASDSMPPTMSTAFNNAVLQYLDNPGQLGAILKELDNVQKAAYGGPGFSK